MTDILDLPNWAVLNLKQGDELTINAEYLVQPDCCLNCGSTSFYKHSPKPVSYRDSPLRGSPVVINAVLKRYRCCDCGGTFIQPIKGIQPEMQMTERCYEYITSKALDDTFTRIAKNIGCDEKTVRSIAYEYITDLNETYEPNVSGWIGLDEITIDGKLHFIITDIVKRKPIDILIDREEKTLFNWLWKYRHEDIKGFAMDMGLPYKKMVNTIFPDVPIVIDKFQVVRMANQAMDGVRINLAKDQPKIIGRDWMLKKALLRMRYKDLDEHGRYNVDMLLDNEPHVAIAHNLKELFYRIYDQSSKKDAEKLLDKWIDIVPPEMKKSQKDFKPLLNAVENWRKEILASFDYPTTNGYTEALDGVAQVISRQSRGYTFDVLRAKLLFRKMPYEKHFEKLNSERNSLKAQLNAELLEIQELVDKAVDVVFIKEQYSILSKNFEKIGSSISHEFKTAQNKLKEQQDILHSIGLHSVGLSKMISMNMNRPDRDKLPPFDSIYDIEEYQDEED